MDDTVNYIPSERRVTVGRKKITVRNLRPVFKDENEREHASQKIQAGLYKVFRKYVGENAG